MTIRLPLKPCRRRISLSASGVVAGRCLSPPAGRGSCDIAWMRPAGRRTTGRPSSCAARCRPRWRFATAPHLILHLPPGSSRSDRTAAGTWQMEIRPDQQTHQDQDHRLDDARQRADDHFVLLVEERRDVEQQPVDLAALLAAADRLVNGRADQGRIRRRRRSSARLGTRDPRPWRRSLRSGRSRPTAARAAGLPAWGCAPASARRAGTRSARSKSCG